MNMKTVCLVIPVLNGEKFLLKQWQSIVESGLLADLDELIYVNDGSTDRTLQTIDSFKSVTDKNIKILNHGTTKGRFLSRLFGARLAQTTHILFLDSRITIDIKFALAFRTLLHEADCLMGHVDIDVNRNVFCLYWDRTHRAIFKAHFEKTKTRVVMTSDNVSNFLKGTTVFFSKRDVFLDVSSKYENQPLLNDDTMVIEEIVRHTPLVLDPSWRIGWVPRESLMKFLGRMWERGPSFAEYHLFTTRGRFFWLILGFAGAFLCLTWLVSNGTFSIYSVLILTFLALISSTAVFSQSPYEFIKMAPLHAATQIVFGSGILWGIFVNIHRRLFKNL